MKSNLQPEHGEIISEEDWNKLYDKIRGSHQICQMPFAILENPDEWLKEKNLEQVYAENMEVIEVSTICHISPANDIPFKYRTDVGAVVFFIKK